MPPKKGKPKGKTSAYAFFSAETKERNKEMGIELDFAEFSRTVSAEWKKVEDRSKYEKLAEADKLRWEREMEEFGPVEKKKKKKKDANAPKRALSAFMFFSKEKRPIIKAQDDSLSVGEVAKKIGSLWKMLSADQKLPYDELAREDRDRYAAEMDAYKKSKGEGSSKSVSKQGAGARRGRKPKVVEEIDEEYDDDEEEEEEESASD